MVILYKFQVCSQILNIQFFDCIQLDGGVGRVEILSRAPAFMPWGQVQRAQHI